MFEEIFKKIRKELDIDDELRETTLKVSRKSVRFSQEAVRAIHRGELEKARENLKKARSLIQDVEKNIKDASPQLYYKGYVLIMHQEFVEGSLFLSLIEGEKEIQGPESLQVSNYAYLQGLGDLIGELRRYSIDAMRNDNLQRAKNYLENMKEIYDSLITLDYPEGLISGIRRKVDIARSLIEKTKNDLAYLQFGNKLVDNINKLIEKLKNTDSN
ncbi:MAG: haloacid dehalogenase [Promethearchaeota archaeon]